MGILESLKGALLVDEPVKKSNDAAPQQLRPLTKAAPAAASTDQSSLLTPQLPENQYLEVLRKVISARQTAFTMLLANASKMESIIPDDVTRMRAALAATDGNARDIATAIDMHRADIEGQRLRFDNTSAQKRNEEMAALNTAMTTCVSSLQADQATLEGLQRQINDLQNRIAANTVKQADLAQQKGALDAKYEAAKNEFTQAMEMVLAELEGKRQALQSYLI